VRPWNVGVIGEIKAAFDAALQWGHGGEAVEWAVV
jgi:hypothetical protein